MNEEQIASKEYQAKRDAEKAGRAKWNAKRDATLEEVQRRLAVYPWGGEVRRDGETLRFSREEFRANIRFGIKFPSYYPSGFNPRGIQVSVDAPYQLSIRTVNYYTAGFDEFPNYAKIVKRFAEIVDAILAREARENEKRDSFAANDAARAQEMSDYPVRAERLLRSHGVAYARNARDGRYSLGVDGGLTPEKLKRILDILLDLPA